MIPLMYLFLIIFIAGTIWYYLAEGYKYSDRYQKEQIEDAYYVTASNRSELQEQSSKIEDMEYRLHHLEQKIDLIVNHLGLENVMPKEEVIDRAFNPENSLWNKSRKNIDDLR